MDVYLKKYCRDSLIISLILVAFSIILIINPTSILNTTIIIIGALLIIMGIVNIFTYFKTPQEFKAFSIKLIIGIISIVLGIILLFNTSMVNTFLIYVIGAWMIIQSIIKLQLSFNIKNLNSQGNWVLILILALITFILGIVILVNPFASLIAIGKLCGIMLLISEIINIFEAIYVLYKV